MEADLIASAKALCREVHAVAENPNVRDLDVEQLKARAKKLVCGWNENTGVALPELDLSARFYFVIANVYTLIAAMDRFPSLAIEIQECLESNEIDAAVVKSLLLKLAWPQTSSKPHLVVALEDRLRGQTINSATDRPSPHPPSRLR